MNKIIWVFLLTVALCSTTHAQKLKLGINAGATYAGFRGTEAPTVTKSPGFGYVAGISLEYRINENLWLKTNLSVERKSYTAKSAYTLRNNYDDFPQDFEQTIHFRFDNVSLPVMAKYDFGNNQSFFINGGFFVGYHTKVSATDKTTPANEFSNRTIDLTSSYKSLDYGLTLGLGKTIKINQTNALVIELRDNLGLAPLNRSPTFSGKNISSNALNLLLGWSFSL